MTCKFQSVLFLTDSQSALCIFFSAPSYLLPESLWYVWSLASSLSNNTSLSFQWVPGHAGLPRNEKADLLAKTGASLPTDAIPSPFPPGYCQSPSLPIPQLETSHLTLPSELPSPQSLFGGSLFLAPYAVSSPVFAAMVTVFFYLHIFTGSVGNRILIVVPVDTPLQDLNHLLLDCRASEPLRKSIFGSSLSILDLWSQTLGCGPTVGSPRSSSAPPSLGRGRVVPPPQSSTDANYFGMRVIITENRDKTGGFF